MEHRLHLPGHPGYGIDDLPVDGGAALARILDAMRDLGRTPGGRPKGGR